VIHCSGTQAIHGSGEKIIAKTMGFMGLLVMLMGFFDDHLMII